MRFPPLSIALLFWAGIFLAGLPSPVYAAPQEERGSVDFEHEVWPIFVNHCIRCHGPEEQQGQLRLDMRAAAFQGGVSGSLFADTGKASLIVQHLMSEDVDERMPFEETPLPKKQIETIVRWIEAGREWPEHIGSGDAVSETHWAYLKPEMPLVPASVDPARGAINPIDYFIRDRLAKENLSPAPLANPATRLRRVYLDLIGLPPPIHEIDRFVRNPSERAYGEIVDRLLASPRFGEKWARRWLDLARYSDSNGYQADQLRDLWAYRDWVISAFNVDMPYDQFTVEQIAGDLLPNATVDQRIATGFHRTPTCNIEAGVDPEENRSNQVIDRVNTTATVWLGATFDCARCHNHKYDPFTQKDYYRLYAFFNNTPLEVENARKDDVQFDFYGPRMELPSDPKMRQRWRRIDADLEAAQKSLRQAKQEAIVRYSEWKEQIIADRLQPSESLSKEKIKELRQWLSQDPAEKTKSTEEKIKQAFFMSDPLIAATQQRIESLQQARQGAAPRTTLVMLELASPRVTRIFKRGDFLSPSQQVAPGVPTVLHPLSSRASPDRLGLATWLVDENNPLASRVRVNHLWAEIFGRGLVATAEDFGRQGTPPSHPGLLDWLAIKFMEDGWSTKRLIRRIVTSATYQQSSERTAVLEQRDPKNDLLAHGPRFRLPAETIRDNGLTIAGLLEEAMAGPPIYPPQPAGIWHQTGRGEPEYHVAQGPDRYRRGVYVIWRRVAPYPSFVNFDAPDRTRCVVERSRTNTPIQALTLLNDEAYVEMARGLARRILEADLTNDRERIAQAFRWCVARYPSEEELSILQRLLSDQRQSLQASPQEALELMGRFAGESPPAVSADPQEWAAWICVANTLLNLDETMSKE